jgi:hypothetical protein
LEPRLFLSKFAEVAARHGGWYARLVRKPGEDTREGSDVARMVVGVRHNNCPVVIDVGGGWALRPLARSNATAYRSWRSTESTRPLPPPAKAA